MNQGIYNIITAYQNSFRLIYTHQPDRSSLPILVETFSLAGRYLIKKVGTGGNDVEVTEENVLEVLTYALTLNCPDVVKKCELFLSTVEPKDILKEAEINLVLLNYLLETNFEHISAIDLCRALHAWSGNECQNRQFDEPYSDENRREVVGDLVHKIPFPRLSAQDVEEFERYVPFTTY